MKNVQYIMYFDCVRIRIGRRLIATHSGVRRITSHVYGDEEACRRDGREGNSLDRLKTSHGKYTVTTEDVGFIRTTVLYAQRRRVGI